MVLVLSPENCFWSCSGGGDGVLLGGFTRGGGGFLRASGDMIKGTRDREQRRAARHRPDVHQPGLLSGLLVAGADLRSVLGSPLAWCLTLGAPDPAEAGLTRGCVSMVLRASLGGVLGEKARAVQSSELCVTVGAHRTIIARSGLFAAGAWVSSPGVRVHAGPCDGPVHRIKTVSGNPYGNSYSDHTWSGSHRHDVDVGQAGDSEL
uniref:Uncharacterized protein n=1 Tax=Knipowitschia caucasica TaxID=637954 RepID=A0AAV2JGK4_KNICA